MPKSNLELGDLVLVTFPGAVETKRRPAVVISTPAYQASRSDVIVGLVTTQIGKATGSSSCLIQDRQAAGLVQPSAFRVYLWTTLTADVRYIETLSESDWGRVRDCLRFSLAV